MKRTFYERFAWPIIIVVVLMAPVTIWAAFSALRTNKNDVKEWLPESFQATQDYKEFQSHFGNETFVLISWDGCTLDDPRVEKLGELLVSPPNPQAPRYFDHANTGQSLLDQLTTPPTNLPRTEALRRLEGSLIGPDGKQSSLALTLTPLGLENMRLALEAVQAAATEAKIDPATVRMGGPPVDNVAIDLEGERMLVTLFLLSGAVGLALAFWYLRDVKLTTMVFIGGGYSATISLALVQVFHGQMNSVLLTMPSVVYTAGLSAAIHIINYYRHGRVQEGLAGSAERGVKAAWIPCLLSAGTTSIGLISLCTSELVPIRTFGFYTSVGVMLTLGFMFLYLPSALQLWPPTLHHDPHAGETSALDPRHRRRMRTLASHIVAHPLAIWSIFVVMFVIGGAGLHKVRTTINLMSLFSPDAEIIHSYRWLEDKLGPLVPMEVVVRLDEKEAKLTTVERFELIERVQNAIKSIPNVGSAMSAATFAPEIPPKRGVMRSVIDKRLTAHRSNFVRDGYLADDPKEGQELWRISLRVAALADVDYGAFIEDIKQQVEPVLEKERTRGVKGIVGATYTGLTPVVYMAERALLDGLVESFFGAFVMIGIVMSVVFRDVRAGFFTMMPNVWPVAVVFGLMSWFNVALDIGTMMTASVAMGVCVYDTVHFANWFRRATRLGLNHHDASVLAFENSAGAIYQSTVIVALGLVTFALSTFMPTHRFGLLMCTLLGFGLVADLVLTPAMLAGPIGRYFTRGCVPKSKTANGQTALDEVDPLETEDQDSCAA